MKKIISLFLTAVLILTMASCGEKTAPWESAEPSDLPTALQWETTSPAQKQETVQPADIPEVQGQIVQEQQSTVPTDTSPGIQPEPEDAAFVPVLDYIPTLVVELKYGTEDNFTGQVIYDFSDAYLRYGTVKKLEAAQKKLNELGYGLKLWDGFRPVSAQFALWEVYPDPVYVANPETGFSSHSRGNTVDVTLVDLFGEEITMPTDFDDFSALADRNYEDCAPVAAENARLLQTVMEEAGFAGYFGEWWHFADMVSYPAEKEFTPLAPQWRRALCDEFITLREQPAVSGTEILKIPRDGDFLVLAKQGDFLLVSYCGLRGYVLESYTVAFS